MDSIARNDKRPFDQIPACSSQNGIISQPELFPRPEEYIRGSADDERGRKSIKTRLVKIFSRSADAMLPYRFLMFTLKFKLLDTFRC